MDTKKMRALLDIFKSINDNEVEELNIIYDLMREGKFVESRRKLGQLLGYEN